MSVTIGIINYNQGRYLGQAITSALDQTCPPSRIIVIDDYSTDGSREMIPRLVRQDLNQLGDVTIDVILGDANIGLAARLNELLAQVDSEFVIWLAADDALSPDAVCLLTSAVEDDVFAVFGNFREIDESGAFLGRIEPKEGWRGSVAESFVIPNFPTHSLLKRTNFISGGLTLLRSSVLREMGGYRAGLTGEDLDMMLRAGKRHKVRYIDHVLGDVRIRANSQSRNHLRHTYDYALIVRPLKGESLRTDYLCARLVMMRVMLTIASTRRPTLVARLGKLSELSGQPVWLLVLSLPSAALMPAWLKTLAGLRRLTRRGRTLRTKG